MVLEFRHGQDASKYLDSPLGPAGIRSLSEGVKRPVREANHLRPSSAEVMNSDLTYISTPSIRCHGLYMETFCCFKFYIMPRKVTFEL